MRIAMLAALAYLAIGVVVMVAASATTGLSPQLVDVVAWPLTVIGLLTPAHP